MSGAARMRTGSALREAWLNVTSGTVRPVALALVALLLTGLLGVADLVTVRHLDAEARAVQAGGGSVSVLAADGRVDPRLCDALASQPGVRAAGALRKASPVYYAAEPQTSLPVFEVTPTFPALVLAGQRSLAGPGVVLSRDAADVVGLQPGETLQTTTGSTPVVAVYDYPEDGRARGYGYAALVPTTSSGPFDACWVDQWPMTTELQRLLHGVLVPGKAEAEGAPITVSQLNDTWGSHLDLRADYTGRLTAWGVPLVFVGLLACAWVGVRLRRLELAAALHLGVAPRSLLAITLAEAVVWLMPAAIVGLALAVVGAVTGTRADLWPNLAAGVCFPAAGVVGGLLGVALGTAGLRESQLFAFFKER